MARGPGTRPPLAGMASGGSALLRRLQRLLPRAAPAPGRLAAMTGRALVLGGGGITGVAWELGILKGLWDGGVDFGAAELVVGTSAGAVVGSQVTTAADLDELVAAQRSSDPATEAELGAEFDLEQMAAMFVGLMQDVTSARELRARIGAMALATARMPEAERLAALSWRLPRHGWPERRLLITAVDIATGELVV